MYGWLDEALSHGAQVVTANRRLARLLTARFNAAQAERGNAAWRRPEIYDWGTWLSVLADSDDPSAMRPVRINSHQSRILWENCLSGELPDSDANLGALVRLAREARSRLVDWQVPLARVGEFARRDDERVFAAALNVYVRQLERNHWVDDAGFAANVLDQLERGKLATDDRIVMLGFTSPSPLFEAFVRALEQRGCRVETPSPAFEPALYRIEFLDEAQEYRAAGAWAREMLTENPQRNVAIVVSGLEGRAAKVGDLVREGFMPGWRTSDECDANGVNVSYGRALSDYPVISTGISLLRWLSGEALRSAELSVLLRSDLCGQQRDDSRIRAELRLRDMPDRNWTLELFAKAFEQPDHDDALAAWIRRLQGAADLLASGSEPETIAETVDEALAMIGWPGESALDSTDFQLINRWRELLNDFVRLALVQPTFSPLQAIHRIATMAGETLFQPESEGTLVNVLGALEASGSEFDALWVTGLTSKQWPPPSKPLALVSTRLQRDYDMPDATPENTSAYARRSLAALAGSASSVTFSFARFDGDAEQAASPILPDCEVLDSAGRDPGWNASTWIDASLIRTVDVDPAPAVESGERVFGGAATLDRQAYSPFDAFAFGRLGLRYVPKFSAAIQPVLRGNLIHDALKRLYQACPDQEDLSTTSDTDRSERIAAAVHGVMGREYRLADPVLRQVLRFEEERMVVLLGRVIDYDLSRDAFRVDSVEQDVTFRFQTLSLRLIADRIDRLAGGGYMILDYKTGAEKKFLTKQEPNSYQLILYGLAFGDDGRDVKALGLYNVDSRVVGINGAGQTLDDRETFGRDVATWTAVALSHLERLVEGDLRINAFQSVRDGRQTALLSRVAELKRG